MIVEGIPSNWPFVEVSAFTRFPEGLLARERDKILAEFKRIGDLQEALQVPRCDQNLKVYDSDSEWLELWNMTYADLVAEGDVLEEAVQAAQPQSSVVNSVVSQLDNLEELTPEGAFEILQKVYEKTPSYYRGDEF